MKLHLIYPNSVFQDQSIYDEADQIWLIEEPLFFRQFKFHQQKLVLHRSSLKHLEQMLLERYPNKVINYVDGKKHGDFMIFKENGEEEFFGTFENGELLQINYGF